MFSFSTKNLTQSMHQSPFFLPFSPLDDSEVRVMVRKRDGECIRDYGRNES